MSRSAERIVSLLWLLLEARDQGRTKTEIFRYLYDQLEGSQASKERQFTRDKQLLSDIGVPIQWNHENQRDGIYQIDQDRLYLPDLDLNQDEISVLHQAQALWMKSPLEDSIHHALTRMTAEHPAIPAIVSAQFDVPYPVLTDIAAAVRQQQAIAFHYRTADEQHSNRRTIRPWAVLMVHQQWYVVGWDFDRQEQRTFRLSRIESQPTNVLASHEFTLDQPNSYRPSQYDVSTIHKRLKSEQLVEYGHIWIRKNVTSSLRLNADTKQVDPHWEYLTFQYHDQDETAAKIASLTCDAVTDASKNQRLAKAVEKVLQVTARAHAGSAVRDLPEFKKTVHARRRPGNKDVIARRLAIVAVINKHGGSLSRQRILDRFGIDERTLTHDLQAMQFWGLPETEFAGGQFEVNPKADPVSIHNSEQLEQPWKLSAPEALGLISGLEAVLTVPGVTPKQRLAVDSLSEKLRIVLEIVDPTADPERTYIYPDLSFGHEDSIIDELHQAALERSVVSMSYFSEHSGKISKRMVEPHNILYADGHVYLRAWCRKNLTQRTFRVDRIGWVRQVGEQFTRQEEHNEIRSVVPTDDQDSLSVVLHASHRYRDILAAYRPSESALGADGSLYARVKFQNQRKLLSLITSFPGHIVVLQPAEVRSHIWQRINEVVGENPVAVR